MKIRLISVLFSLPLLLHLPIRAEEPSVVEQRLRKDLAFLTSGNCEGRGIDTKGIERAAEYIAREFENAGLKPGGGKGSYFQTWRLILRGKAGPKNRIVVSDPTGKSNNLERDKDFAVVLLGGKGKVHAPVVFAGYGLTAPDLNYDDFAGLDVKGKIVVVLTGTPQAKKGSDDVFAAADAKKRTGRYRDLRTRLVNAIRHDAAAVVVVNNRRTAGKTDRLPRSFYSARMGDPVGIPVVQVKRDAVAAMIKASTGSELAKLEEQIDNDLKPRSAALAGWKIQLETDVEYTAYTVKNVIGVLEGSGPLKNETIVLGAHYDHMGKGSGQRNSLRRGVSSPGGVGGAGFPLSEMNASAIFYGADDNASGTSTIMELARQFGKRERQGRRLVFIAFTAEERGLLGSRYYCQNPVFPLESTAAMINCDMVGRLQEGKLLVSGLGTAKPFRPMIDELNKKHKLNLVKRDPSGGSSDHASFLAMNVPIFSFFTGFHEQYHRPSDQLPTINITGMRRIVGLVNDLTYELRTIPRPAFQRPEGSVDRRTTLWASAPSIGIWPDFNDSGPGILVDTVVNRTAAANAELRPGDRITSVNGRKVAGLTAYLSATRKLKAGTDVKLTIQRDGKSMPIVLNLVPATRGFFVSRLGLELAMTMSQPKAPFKEGLRVIRMDRSDAAAKAGVKIGDRLKAIGDVVLKDRAAVVNAIGQMNSAKTISLVVDRRGKSVRIPVELPPIIRVRFGFTLDYATPGKGIRIINVIPKGPAAIAGLQKDDVLIKIDGQRVSDRRSYEKVAQTLTPGNKVGMTILRNGQEMPVTVVPRNSRR